MNAGYIKYVSRSTALFERCRFVEDSTPSIFLALRLRRSLKLSISMYCFVDQQFKEFCVWPPPSTKKCETNNCTYISIFRFSLPLRVVMLVNNLVYRGVGAAPLEVKWDTDSISASRSFDSSAFVVMLINCLSNCVALTDQSA